MSILRRFSADKRGSIPMIFAVSAVPLLGVTGLAVDYARATQARTVLQSAADSTVLMLALKAPKNDEAALGALATPYFQAVLNGDPGISPGAIGITKGTNLVTLSASATVKTFLPNLVGISEWSISVKAASAYGAKKIEVALVLDNTGSMMSSNKIGELKKASKTLVSILESSSVTPGQIRVAVVPYTTVVRLPTSYRDEPWLTNTPTGSFYSSPLYTRPSIRTSWTGCVADRDKPHNTKDTPASVANPASLYPMVNCLGAPAEIMPLTDDWNKLRTRIDSMGAGGMTNITVGAQWGLEMLTSTLPFNETGATSDVQRFMILLTDGENTLDRWAAGGASMNNDTKAICDTITERGVPESAKVHRINLYTVLVIDGNEPLLKSCATKPEMYFKVNAASQLENVFKAIASEIGQVRLTM